MLKPKYNCVLLHLCVFYHQWSFVIGCVLCSTTSLNATNSMMKSQQRYYCNCVEFCITFQKCTKVIKITANHYRTTLSMWSRFWTKSSNGNTQCWFCEWVYWINQLQCENQSTMYNIVPKRFSIVLHFVCLKRSTWSIHYITNSVITCNML